MYCKNCFKKISSRSQFCKYCGAPVKQRNKDKENVLEELEILPAEEQKKTEEPERQAELVKKDETEEAEETSKDSTLEENQAEPSAQSPAPLAQAEEPPVPPERKEYRFKLRSEKEKDFPISPKAMGIGIAAILLVAVIAVFMNSSLFQSPESINYNEYIGVWQERGVEDVESSGGVRLEIISVDGGTLVLSMGFYDGGAAYNGIEVKNIGAVIKDGAAYYTFSNDGYGNSGNGVLTFKGRDIEWKSVINKEEPNYYTVSKVKNSVDEETTESKAESAEETSESKTDGDYVLPDSSTKYLSEKDLEGLTPEELRIARNEIMARHGRKFDDPALAAYFESKDWYNGTIDPETFDSQTVSELNEYEIKNIALIQSME